MDVFCRATSVTHTDSTIDQRDCWKRGYIVNILPTGWPYGAKEVIPPISGGNHVRIHLTRADSSPIWEHPTPYTSLSQSIQDRIKQFLQPEFSGSVRVRRAQWEVLVDSLPGGVLSTLNQTGEYTVTWPTLRTYVMDLASGSTAEQQGIDLE